MIIRKRKGVARKESVKYNENLSNFKDHMKKVADEISNEHIVLPDPVLSRLDIIIELLEALAKNPKNRGVTG